MQLIDYKICFEIHKNHDHIIFITNVIWLDGLSHNTIDNNYTALSQDISLSIIHVFLHALLCIVQLTDSYQEHIKHSLKNTDSSLTCEFHIFVYKANNIVSQC